MAPKTKQSTTSLSTTTAVVAPVPAPVQPTETTQPKRKSPAKTAPSVPTPAPVVVPAPTPIPVKKTKAVVDIPVAPATPATVATPAPAKRGTKKETVSTADVTPAQIIVNSKVLPHPVSGENVTLAKTKRVPKPKDPNAPPPAPRKSAYNDYMKLNIAKLKAEAVSTGTPVDHRALFRQVATQWKTSSEKAAADAARATAAK